MAVAIPFRRDLAVEYGVLEPVTPLIRRIVARNPSPFTFKGTGTYVVGHGTVAVIDPGPDLPDHVEALADGLRNETISHIVVTHTHRDHSPAAAELKRRTGARTYAFGPHGTRYTGEGTEAGADFDFTPDVRLTEGDTVTGPGWTLTGVHTPGHTSNHLCFALAEERAFFSGDHVMGWSTSVIAPPDGDMTAYMESLEKLLPRDDRLYWPTHGSAIPEPQSFVAAFIAHRREREAGILARIGAGDHTIAEMVPILYADVHPGLHPAAARSVLAHLVDLARRGKVVSDGPPDLMSRFRLP